MTFKDRYKDKLELKTKPVLLSKETFVEIITKMRERDEKLQKVSDGLEAMLDGYACISVNNELDNTILKLLKELMLDTTDTIEWWLYENVEKVITITAKSNINKTSNDVKVEIRTIEDLYDYLTYFI